MSGLAKKTCLPCQGGVPPLPLEEILEFKRELHSDWVLTHGETRLYRTVKFKDFAIPMQLGHRIGVMAEEQWHHPELVIGWGHLDIEIWTHKIDGLVESDFIFAAKVDEILLSYFESNSTL